MKKKYRILVVDDEENIRHGLSAILTGWNYEVLVAENGEDALNVFNKAACDLVITDKMMPGMNGIELLMKVKEVSPDVGVIVITAFGEVDLCLEAMNHGALAYLNKPLDLTELKKHISSHFSQKSKGESKSVN